MVYAADAYGQAVTEFIIPTPNAPASIAAGPDGNLWFTESLWFGGTKSSIGRILAHSPNTITEFPLPGKTFASSIVGGPDGNIWFTESNPYDYPQPQRPRIGRFQPDNPGIMRSAVDRRLSRADGILATHRSSNLPKQGTYVIFTCEGRTARGPRNVVTLTTS